MLKWLLGKKGVLDWNWMNLLKSNEVNLNWIGLRWICTDWTELNKMKVNHIRFPLDCAEMKTNQSAEQWGSAGSYLCFLGLVLMSPRTLMSEKSILKRLSRVAILPAHSTTHSTLQYKHTEEMWGSWHVIQKHKYVPSVIINDNKWQKMCGEKKTAIWIESLCWACKPANSRSAVVVDAVDFPTDEDADPAVAPLLLIGQQVGDQQSQAWSRGNSAVTEQVNSLSYFLFEGRSAVDRRPRSFIVRNWNQDVTFNLWCATNIPDKYLFSKLFSVLQWICPFNVLLLQRVI